MEREISMLSEIVDHEVAKAMPYYHQQWGERDAARAACLAVTKEIASKGWLVLNTADRVWWKADRSGYTGDITLAGRYSLEEAMFCASIRRETWGPAEVVVPSPELATMLSAPRPEGSGTK